MNSDLDPLIGLSASEDGSEVEMHLDQEGIKQLIKELEQLKSDLDKGECEHAHLMTKSWGWSGLTESKLQKEHKQVFHLKIFAWTQEWRQKHGL